MLMSVLVRGKLDRTLSLITNLYACIMISVDADACLIQK